MKTFIKTFLLTVGLGLLALQLMGASGQVSLLTNAGVMLVSNGKAYANSQVDTIIFSRDRAVAAASFAARWKDSVSITNAIVRRVYAGQVAAVVAGDTLTAFNTFASTSNTGTSVGATITMNPLADQYWIILTYAGSNNGYTSATAVYEVGRQYNTSP